MKSIKLITVILSLLLTLSSCNFGKKSEFPLYKNVSRQCCDDGWVFTFVYEYEKENVEKIEGLIDYYFFGFNVRYRYAEDYVEQYQVQNKDGSIEMHNYHSGALIWGKSQETAHDSYVIDQLLRDYSKDELLNLDENSVDFTAMRKEVFFQLMNEALTGTPQAEAKQQSYWDLPNYAALAEPEFLDGYKFQICFLNETGLIDVCYIDLLYQTGNGQMDYIQLSDLVESGEASDVQIQCFDELSKLAKSIEENDTFLAGTGQYENIQFGDIEMGRLCTVLHNIHIGNYMQYVASPIS